MRLDFERKFEYLEYCLCSVFTYFRRTTNTARTCVKCSSDKRTLQRRVSHIRQYSTRTTIRHACQPTSSGNNGFFSNFMDKLAGAINRPCSIGVLCTIATHSTQILSEIVALCTIATHSTRKRPQIHFCNLTPHIFTRTQCSFINNTASLCRLEDYNKTWLLPGVPRDTF